MAICPGMALSLFDHIVRILLVVGTHYELPVFTAMLTVSRAAVKGILRLISLHSSPGLTAIATPPCALSLVVSVWWTVRSFLNTTQSLLFGTLAFSVSFVS